MNYPTLLLLGEKDKICLMKDTHKMFSNIKCKDLTIH